MSSITFFSYPLETLTIIVTGLESFHNTRLIAKSYVTGGFDDLCLLINLKPQNITHTLTALHLVIVAMLTNQPHSLPSSLYYQYLRISAQLILEHSQKSPFAYLIHSLLNGLLLLGVKPGQYLWYIKDLPVDFIQELYDIVDTTLL